MASTKDQEKAAGGRFFLLISLAALSFFSALALGRVFRGGGTPLHLGLAALAATALAGAMERRHILLATALSLAGLMVALGVLVFPETTRLWLPTLSTVRTAWRSLQDVNRAAAAEIAPALPLPPLVLAALAATWTSAFASHALAARARSPFLALLPPAALLAFSNLILSDSGRPPLVLAFMAAALGILFADGSWRIHQWGPVTYWQNRATSWPGAGAGFRSARRVGLVCLGIAVFTPWLLPGYHAAGLVNTQDQRSTTVSINPILDVRPQLQRTPSTPLFTVETTKPSYWRLLTYDVFTGQMWRPSNDASTGGVVVPSPSFPQAFQLLGPAPSVTSDDTRQNYQFQQLRTAYLPAAAEPIAIDAPEEIRYDRAQSILVAPTGTGAGFSYSVISRTPAPTADELDVFATLAPGSTDQRFIQLPARLSSQFGIIAHALTDDQATPYRKILALQTYLRSSVFQYDLKAPPAPNGDQLLNFLTRSRRGYCVQFASTMALLLRELGIPARVAQGYTTGKQDPTDPARYEVTTAEAHTWVEVLFPGYGWLPFEPTPTRSNPATNSYFALPPAGNTAPDPECTLSFQGKDGCVVNKQTRPRPRGQPRTLPAEPAPVAPVVPPGAFPTERRPWLRAALLWVPVALLIALAAIPALKAGRRRLVLSRAGHRPKRLVLASYAVLAAEAGDVGLARRPHETLWEYRARLEPRIAGLDAQLTQLMGLTGRAVYSDRDISPLQARRAAAAARDVGRALRRSVGRFTRLLGWFRLQRWTPSRPPAG
jgi:transglutaminase-like putative cysteine protease